MTDEEKRKLLARMKAAKIILALCENDKIEGKAVPVEQGLKDYFDCIKILTEMQENGDLTFNCDDPTQPYVDHWIRIKWKPYVEVEGKSLSLFEKVSFSEGLSMENDEWDVRFILYTEE